MHSIDDMTLCRFKKHLVKDEKSKATIKKYTMALKRLSIWLNGRKLSKDLLLQYRDLLLENKKAQSVNSYISAINTYLNYFELEDLKLKLVKVQRQAFIDETKELTEKEYKRLLNVAKNKGNERLYLLMLTLCSTGIRVSELSHITVEASKKGQAEIYMKGKYRKILLPKELSKRLLLYAKDKEIQKGTIFITKNGYPMDRSNICHDLKKICQEAKVSEDKVYPHNFRHLFARKFFEIEKNIAHLADVLGHSHIETTRIYVAVSATKHLKILNKMHLIE